jgi:SAM-dependent methyltransferase
MTPEMEALKTKLKATWMAGDFGQIARGYAPGAQDFVSRLNLAPGTRALDVACGTGNLAIPAARAGAKVTGVDIAPNLLEQGRARAKAEGLAVQFDEGDAEAMPYPDASFDVVMTMFGAMFAPRPDKTAAELLRVCRPGGRIAMANWTPAGFIGQMFKITGSHVPPPPNVPSPILWGDQKTVPERLSGVKELTLTPRMITFNYPMTPPEVVEFFRLYYGPTQRAFAALDDERQKPLRADLEKHWSQHDRGTGGSTAVDSEYLEVVAVR